MSQQSAIFAALFLGFVVFITMKGKLPAYVALLWSRSKASSSGTGAVAVGPGSALQSGPLGGISGASVGMPATALPLLTYAP